MANNILVKDANGDVRVVKSTEIAGVHVAHHVIDGITTVAGEVSISGTVPVTGSVTVTNQPSSLTISNFPPFPTTQQVSLIANSSINIGTMPSVTLANPVTSLSINNLPAIQNTSVTNWPASQNVVITSMPAVSGMVTVSDGDGALTVDGTVDIGTLPAITGSVEITNASMEVIGNVAVTNALTLNNSTNTIGKVLLRNAGADVDAGNPLPVAIISGGGGGVGGGEVTIADGQSVGITGNVTVQGTVGVAGEVDLGVDVVASAGLQALAVAVTEGSLKLKGTNGNDISGTNPLPVEVTFPASQPVRLQHSTGNSFTSEAAPLPTRLFGASGVAIGAVGGRLSVALDTTATQNVAVVGTPTVNLSTSAQVALKLGASAVSTSNRLPVALDTTTPLNVAIVSGGTGGGEVTIAAGQSVGIEGSVAVTGTFWPTTQPVSGQITVDTTTPLDVNIVSGGGGGTFDGQLTQGGNDVSTSNRLPVDIGEPTVSIGHSVTIDAAMTNSQPQKLEVKLQNSNGQTVGLTSGLYVQPADSTIFRVAPAAGSEGYFNVALLNAVEIQGTPTVNANVAAEYTSLTIGRVTINGGATPVALASASAKAVDIVNHTSTDLEYRIGGAGEYMFLAAKSADQISPVTNANEISIRRVDGSSTAITVSYKVLA